ncbi:Haloacetate dehalogenase H-2 [Paramyrothecium foliicola]|nr:Haloacetate dehalogenase H-2 [Paramyrothecium foliicola]
MTQDHRKTKAVFFDFMGTCLNWHEAVSRALPSSIPYSQASQMAIDWRKAYFQANAHRLDQQLPPEDIDSTLARTLNSLLDNEYANYESYFNASVLKNVVEAWHFQPAWPEVNEATRAIREDLGLETFVHANGTTRLQLDLTRSSGLSFNMLFSSQLLGVYKPSLDAYKRALELVKLGAEEVIMVAAHAYDLRGAQRCGMKTVYVHRWTDDVNEDMDKVKLEFDAFLEDMKELPAVISKLAKEY